MEPVIFIVVALVCVLAGAALVAAAMCVCMCWYNRRHPGCY